MQIHIPVSLVAETLDSNRRQTTGPVAGGVCIGPNLERIAPEELREISAQVIPA